MSVDSASGKSIRIASPFMQPQKANPEEKLKEVADLYEKQFLREMMKAMRSTVHEGEFMQANQAEKIFREQLDNEYVEKWGAKGGIGLSQLIYNQLVDRYGVQMGIKAPTQKPQGPIALDAKSNFTAHPFHDIKKSPNKLSWRIDRMLDAQDLKIGGDPIRSESIRAPWNGKLLGNYQLDSGETVVDIEHEDGFRSKLFFQGLKSSLQTGQNLQAGDVVGYLSPEAKGFWWNMEAAKPQGKVEASSTSDVPTSKAE